MKSLVLAILIASFISLQATAQAPTNRGMYFDGVDDQVFIAQNAALDFGGGDSYTIEMWVKIPNYSFYNLISKSLGGSCSGAFQNEIYLSVGLSGEVAFFTNVFNTLGWHEAVTATGVVVPNQWVHIACVYNNGAKEIYINGISQTLTFSGSPSTPGVACNTPWRLGGEGGIPGAGLGYMKGQLDEVRIYNSVRNASQIQADMASTAANGALAYWDFEDDATAGNQTVATNIGSLGASANGTLTNNPYWALRVTNTLDDVNQGSLRWAMNEANTDTDTDYIDFSIPSAAPWDININSSLSIEEAAIVDATSQPGWEENTAGKRINIYKGTGFSTAAPQIAFDIGKNSGATSDVEIYGFNVLNFRFGPDAQDVAFLVNNFGSRNNIKIGAQGKGNVTNFCKRSVTFYAPTGSTGNVVAYNRFGTDETGTTASVSNDGNNDIIVIEAPLTIEYNVITKGISVFDAVSNNIIRNNKIGTGIAGTENFSSSITNTSNGIRLGGGYNTVRDNVIGNYSNPGAGNAIQVWGHNNQILFNRIGIGTGGQNLANTIGIHFTIAGAGGDNFVRGNVISNNTSYAISIEGTRKAHIAENEIYCNTLGVNSSKSLPTISGLSGTTLSGTAGAGDNLYIYKDNAGCVNKQGQDFIAINAVDASGNWTYNFMTAPSVGDVITVMSVKVAAGDSLSSPFSAAFVVPAPSADFYTLGDADWQTASNWSNDGTTSCACKPDGVPNANVRVRHNVSIGGSANVAGGTKIDIQNPVTLTMSNTSFTLAELKGVSGAKIKMNINALPSVTTNSFASTAGTIVEFAAAASGNIPLTFGGILFKNLYISGSGAKNADGVLSVQENFQVFSGATFNLLSSSFTVDGNTTIEGTLNDNTAGGTNYFRGTIFVASTGFFQETSTNSNYVFENDITNDGKFSLGGGGTYTFNKSSGALVLTNNSSVNQILLYPTGQTNCDVTIKGGTGAKAITFRNLTISADKTITNEYQVVFFGGICNGATATSTWLNATNSRLTINNAAMPMATGVLDVSAIGNQVYYDGNAENVKAANYREVFFSFGPTKTLSGDITVLDKLGALSGTSPTLDLATHTIDIKGAFSGSNVTSPMTLANGIAKFSGANIQTISGKTAFDKIEIDNPSNVEITAAENTANAITFTQGRLQLGANDFTLTNPNPSDQITQSFTASSTSYVETNGIGRLIRNNLAAGVSYVFPIGDASSIRHISIKPNTTGNAAAKFETNITPAPSNPPNNDQAAGMWLLSGLDAEQVTFENSGCISPNSKVNYYDSSTWSAADILTTYSSPVYTASGANMDFSTGKTYTVFGSVPVSLSITPTTISDGVVGVVYDQINAFNASGGFAPYTLSIISGTLPTGLGLNTSTNRIEGMPTEAGTFTFRLQVQDNASNVGTQDYTFTIAQGTQFVSAITVTETSAGSYSIEGYSNVGLALSYFSTNEEVATVSGNVVTIHTEAAGEAEIRAFQPGDANYLASDTTLVMRVNGFGLVNALDTSLEKSIKIYPNPSSEKVWIESSDYGLEIEKIRCFNALGQEIELIWQENEKNQWQTNIFALAKGLYSLHIHTQKGIIRKKFVKM
ncbi:MAG: LamG-like jellyroll fold domain-containing protein [Thermonemataceae bacterium]|nr:LamG-like jellyroll fold domain-containing protein [Thermonemataceae bacterium]